MEFNVNRIIVRYYPMAQVIEVRFAVTKMAISYPFGLKNASADKVSYTHGVYSI